MEEKKCPACSHALEECAERCPNCGLADLNRIFLSREEHQAWVNEVLLPHRASLAPPRVYAGGEHVLILTGGGRLYGLGDNALGQIREGGGELCGQPEWMADNVLHAAAGKNYSIYVTRDGQVHMRGVGEFEERFPGFSGASQVYADSDADRFWIVDGQGQVFFFGDNDYALRGSRQVDPVQATLAELPEESFEFTRGEDRNRVLFRHTDGRPDDYHNWDHRERTEAELKAELTAGDAYRRMVKAHGDVNLHLSFNVTSTQHVGGEYLSEDGERIRWTVIPEIVYTNNHIYAPELCRSQGFASTPHRYGLMPDPALGDRLSPYEKVKKVAYVWPGVWTEDDSLRLLLLEDGQTRLRHWGEDVPLFGVPQPVYDLAVGKRYAILSCHSGDILWADREDLTTGDLQSAGRVTLPGEGQLAWMDKAPLPHEAPPRVYAGRKHVLILTGGGRLYGLGDNANGQIREGGDEFYSEPEWMADDVVHAAAGRDYSIYVTRDGEVHLLGAGEYQERFPGFSGASRVYADLEHNSFWIVDQRGQKFFFGDNGDHKERFGTYFLSEKVETLATLPEETCESGYWDTNEVKKQLEEKLKAGDVYRQMAKTYGSANVAVYLEMTSSENILRPRGKRGKYASNDERRRRRTFSPAICYHNDRIYTPEKHSRGYVDTPYRCGSAPYHLSYDENSKLPPYRNLKKGAYFSGEGERYYVLLLVLLEDGQVRLHVGLHIGWSIGDLKEVPLNWTPQPVCDLAVGRDYAILSCYNGDILWMDRKDLEDGDIQSARRVTLPGVKADEGTG